MNRLIGGSSLEEANILYSIGEGAGIELMCAIVVLNSANDVTVHTVVTDYIGRPKHGRSDPPSYVLLVSIITPGGTIPTIPHNTNQPLLVQVLYVVTLHVNSRGPSPTFSIASVHSNDNHMPANNLSIDKTNWQGSVMVFPTPFSVFSTCTLLLFLHTFQALSLVSPHQ